ncbi:MAG: FtsQ-type POTRA domain-containing protein [Chloroflexi bacterium]|nr:FtsQ-type POTRA domain-containing protein [Chloroflexota bacterium]
MAEGTLNRADQVRSRRLQRREGKPILSRGAPSQAPAIPRMVARNPVVEQRLAALSGRELRRRRYLKLADAGAELRLPALPNVHVGWRVVSGLVAGMALIALYFMWSASAFTVSSVDLRGAERLDAATVDAVIKVVGSSIFSVESDQIFSLLREQFPELQSVNVSVGFPAKVVVRVEERAPVLVWEQAGLTVWVDAAGMAFIPQGGGDGLIQVTALEAPPTLGESYAQHQLIRPEMVKAIQALSQIAPQGAPLIYDPRLGFGWTDPGGWQAFFGQDGQNMTQRLAVYLAILSELSARNLTPTLISVAQLHAPYFRMDY